MRTGILMTLILIADSIRPISELELALRIALYVVLIIFSCVAIVQDLKELTVWD